MRRIALIVALLAALAGGAVVPRQAHAACILVVVWHDQAYFAIGSPETLPAAGAAVHGAVEPGCNDTGGGITELPTPVAARRVAGVPPGLALLVRDTVLVAHGYIAGLPTAATLPTDATRGCRLGGPVRITGPANVGLGSLSVPVSDSTVRLHHLLRGAAHIVVDGGTRIEGLVRRGQAYIGEGQLVQVDARFCMVPGSIGTKIVARHITPAGPIVPASTAEDILGDDWRGKPGIVSKATDGHALAVAIVLLVAAIGIGTALTAHRRRSLPPPTG
jgi:hypothetical protein